MYYTPRFCQMKYLIEIYICGKFHQYIANVVVKLKKFKVFCVDSTCMIFGSYFPQN